MSTVEKRKTAKKEAPGRTASGFQDTYFIIMAGGKGERFWPLSTELVPKPFVSLTGKKTLIELTVDRARRIVPIDHILVVLGKEHLPVAKKCLSGLPRKNFIVEPVGRDTAPCVGLAAGQPAFAGIARRGLREGGDRASTPSWARAGA